jgi:hypothetical protein
MKKVLILVIVLVCTSGLCASEPNVPPEKPQYISFRLMSEPQTYQNTNLEGWIGYGKKDSEVGLCIGWREWTEAETENDTQSSLAVGGFSLVHFPDFRKTLEDIIWPVEWLPENIEVSPALGLQIMYDLEGQGVRITPLVEMKIYDNIAIQYKYNFGNALADNSQVGISIIIDF